ncbi:hypothetical protein ABEV41_01910 [Geobacillus thermodenitrificans]|uniref:hypothetical protein n=1 Tax=Geobacillus thermodenitrificans TaxID=33940 RepID=UPI003D22E630
MEKLDKHFGLRLGCIVLLWFALGGTILNSKNQQSFLGALILYLLPLALDYNSQMPKEEKNQRRQALGVWSAVIFASIFAGMMFSGFNFESFILQTWFKYTIWILCLFYVVLAAVDWVAYSSPEEIEHRQKIQALYRKRNSHEPFANRVEYYKDGNSSSRKVIRKNEEGLKTGKSKTGTD